MPIGGGTGSGMGTLAKQDNQIFDDNHQPGNEYIVLDEHYVWIIGAALIILILCNIWICAKISSDVCSSKTAKKQKVEIYDNDSEIV